MQVEIVKAILLAQSLRTTHNGVFGVYLYLGHDGDNACTLKDADGKEVGRGGSGRSLLEAVEQAETNMRRRRFMRMRDAEWFARLAAERFGLVSTGADGVFNTSSVQNLATERFCYTPTPSEVEELFSLNPHIVRLKGGSHWMVLPVGFVRFAPDAA